ncbi:MAG TPA: DUF4382 domain-containing protein [Clostridia bacterium]|nr:DUF4382 domain-containing protein [Clostridia bacterium]
MRRKLLWMSVAAVLTIAIAVGCGGGGGSTSTQMARVNLSLSDPPTCAGPSGAFGHVYVTIKDVKIHTSASANENDGGWVDLTPDLSKAPQQVDLLGIANNNCFLAMLGSQTALQPGTYQQIRVYLADDAAAGTITGNKCNGAANCVVLAADNSVHALDLSSESRTGIKIPSGQLAGGKFVIAAGETKDLNIDFDACASIVSQTGGRFRLKPVLHAGEVKLTSSSVSGKLVDQTTNAPIVGGKAIVALESRDASGVNRVVMQVTPDASGNFVLCPVPTGTYDVVAVAVSGSGVAYAATVATGVQPGNALGNIPMVAQTGTSTAPASITGQVTTTKGTATVADVTLATLQSITVGGTTVNIVVPLAQQSSATATVPTTTDASCPANTACASYTLSVPAMQPNVGTFAAAGTTYTQATTTPVAYSVNARAFVQGSGATPDCSPSEVTVATLAGGGALTVTPGASSAASTGTFTGCQ